MSQPVPTKKHPPSTARRWSRRLLKGLGWFLLGVVLLVLGLSWYLRWTGSQRLQAALTEADRLDPNWRWEELQAARAVVPDADNAALRVEAVGEQFPQPWKWELPPVEELDATAWFPEGLAGDVRGVLAKRAGLVAEARKLAGFRTGRYPAVSPVDYWSGSPVPHLGRNRIVASLLWLDAALLSHEQKSDAALLSARALLGTGRAIGDEPSLVAQHRRLAARRQTLTISERILAQGEPSDDALKAIQQDVAEEVKHPLLLTAARGERAIWDEIFGLMAAGEFDRLAGKGGLVRHLDRSDPRLANSGVLSGVEHWLKVGWYWENRGAMLEWSTQAVELARLPVPEQVDRYEQRRRAINLRRISGLTTYREYLACRMAEDWLSDAREAHCSEAELLCLGAGLAAERYRRAHDHWPDSLEQLTPDWLPRIPLDPFTGEPLHFRRADEGLTIYSVGPEKKDHGGTFARQAPSYELQQDYGIRLWDVKVRRERRPEPERPER